MKEILKTFSDRKEAIIYCGREETIDIWDKLNEAKIPIVDVKKLLSHRKQKDLKTLQDLAQDHPSFELEARLLKTVLRRNIFARREKEETEKRALRKDKLKKQKKQQQQQ